MQKVSTAFIFMSPLIVLQYFFDYRQSLLLAVKCVGKNDLSSVKHLTIERTKVHQNIWLKPLSLLSVDWSNDVNIHSWSQTSWQTSQPQRDITLCVDTEETLHLQNAACANEWIRPTRARVPGWYDDKFMCELNSRKHTKKDTSYIQCSTVRNRCITPSHTHTAAVQILWHVISAVHKGAF